MTKTGILNYTKAGLAEKLVALGLPGYRIEQIFVWLYRFGKTSFYEMTNLGKDLQRTMDDLFYIYRPELVNAQKSNDGTIKFLLRLNDGNTIETVFIPELKRNTICISSQVGCAVGCKFCNTGYNGFMRNLSTEEIISQFLLVKDHLGFWGNNCDNRRLSNVVFMGMGEPLFNYENVAKVIENLMLDEREGISSRRITLSTSGISNVLKVIAKDLPCRLAISLHASNNEIRSRIMPINDLHNIESVLEACKEYTRHHGFLKITFEYLLLNGVNDSKECARELIGLLRGVNAKVNLLQFNHWVGCEFEPSPRERVLAFAKTLENSGLEAPIRARRGEDIMAACGQLSSNNI